MRHRKRPSLRAPLTWLGLALAASPVLLGWISDLRADPTDRYVAVPALALLALIVLDRHRRAPRRPRLAAIALSLAALLLLGGIALDVVIIARLGAALGLCGLAAMHGRPRLATAALGFALVPLPTTLLQLASPALETTLAVAASAILRALGAEVDAVGPVLRGPGPVQLALLATDGGLPTLVALASTGWALALARGGLPAQALHGAARAGVLVLLVQPLAMLLAAALVAAGQPDAARAFLSFGIYALVLVAALALACRRRASTSSMHSSTSAT